jgi:uncharacterized membrane protein YcgQ (UPF0703/DUF1980 family)
MKNQAESKLYSFMFYATVLVTLLAIVQGIYSIHIANSGLTHTIVHQLVR